MSTDQPKYLWGKLNPRYTGPKAAQKMDSDQATQSAASSDFSSSVDDSHMFREVAEEAFFDLIGDTMRKDIEMFSRLDGLAGVAYQPNPEEPWNKEPFCAKDFFANVEQSTLNILEEECEKDSGRNMLTPGEDGDDDPIRKVYATGLYNEALSRHNIDIDHSCDDPILNQLYFDMMDEETRRMVSSDNWEKYGRITYNVPKASLPASHLDRYDHDSLRSAVRVAEKIAEGSFINQSDMAIEQSAKKISSNLRKNLIFSLDEPLIHEKDEAQRESEEIIISHLGGKVKHRGQFNDAQERAVKMMAEDHLDANLRIIDTISSRLLSSSNAKEYIDNFDREEYQRCIEKAGGKPEDVIKDPEYYLNKAADEIDRERQGR